MTAQPDPIPTSKPKPERRPYLIPDRGCSVMASEVRRVYAARQEDGDCHILYLETGFYKTTTTLTIGCLYHHTQETADAVVQALNMFIERLSSSKL